MAQRTTIVLSSLLPALICATAATGCSISLELDQCQSDSDCGPAGQCVDAICREPQYVDVTDFISEDTTWTADKIYVLKNVVVVTPGATLTIEAGTKILGERNTALVTQAGGRLIAVGTRDNPIVFTSAKPVGQRRAGDWGGLALLGNARVNRPNFTLNILTNEEEVLVGGEDDEWDCGTLKYVRTEFGGGRIDGEKALNGLTIGGCGRQTTIDYVQAHFGADDGIEIFGGTVDIRHAVSTRPQQGDAFDLDVGWRGTGQFLAAQMDVNGEEGIELENRGEEPDATPQSDIQIFNYTILGSTQTADLQRGVIVKSGGRGLLSHGIITRPTTSIPQEDNYASIHVEGVESIEHTQSGEFRVETTLFDATNPPAFFTAACQPCQDDSRCPADRICATVGCVPTGEEVLPETQLCSAAADFDADAYFRQSAFNNRFGLSAGFDISNDLGEPDWTPSTEHTTGRDISPPPEGFDPTAVYLGAFSPSAPAWTEGWTAYPKN